MTKGGFIFCFTVIYPRFQFEVVGVYKVHNDHNMLLVVTTAALMVWKYFWIKIDGSSLAANDSALRRPLCGLKRTFSLFKRRASNNLRQSTLPLNQGISTTCLGFCVRWGRRCIPNYWSTTIQISWCCTPLGAKLTNALSPRTQIPETCQRCTSRWSIT